MLLFTLPRVLCLTQNCIACQSSRPGKRHLAPPLSSACFLRKNLILAGGYCLELPAEHDFVTSCSRCFIYIFPRREERNAEFPIFALVSFDSFSIGTWKLESERNFVNQPFTSSAWTPLFYLFGKKKVKYAPKIRSFRYRNRIGNRTKFSQPFFALVRRRTGDTIRRLPLHHSYVAVVQSSSYILLLLYVYLHLHNEYTRKHNYILYVCNIITFQELLLSRLVIFSNE